MAATQSPYEAAAMTPGDICGVLGPDIRISPQYLRAARCNRVKDHERLADPNAHEHAERNPDTFAVLARWTAPRDVAPNKRRIK
jgi:hypothetical protein